jgi:Fe-S cluster assembly protein SufD
MSLWAKDRYDDLIEKASPSERSFRERAWDAYRKQGLPEHGLESWKYSTPATWLGREWVPSIELPTIPAWALTRVIPWTSRFEVVFLVNGRLVNQKLPSGVSARSFDRDLNLNFDDGVISASTALSVGGVQIDFGTSSSQKPLLLVHVHSGDAQWTAASHHVQVAAGVRAELVEIFVSQNANYLRTDISRVDVSEGGSLEWVRLQMEGQQASFLADVQAHLDKHSRVSVTQINAGAQWSRNSLKFDVRGAGAEAQVNGMTFGAGQSHIDQRVQISHHVGDTSSSQLFKGILKDRSRGVLNGKIFIGPHAQRVNSSQLNHNLLLSPHAEADTKPELEIFADDVKANHGATVGRLDEERLFYLLSRGIPLSEAQHILARAFVDDVTMKIRGMELRQIVNTELERLVPEFLRDIEEAT